MIDAIPSVAGKPEAPKRRLERVSADRSLDLQPHRENLSQRSTQPFLAKRNTPHGSGLGVYRWVGERTFGWLHQFC